MILQGVVQIGYQHDEFTPDEVRKVQSGEHMVGSLSLCRGDRQCNAVADHGDPCRRNTGQHQMALCGMTVRHHSRRGPKCQQLGMLSNPIEHPELALGADPYPCSSAFPGGQAEGIRIEVVRVENVDVQRAKVADEAAGLYYRIRIGETRQRKQLDRSDARALDLVSERAVRSLRSDVDLDATRAELANELHCLQLGSATLKAVEQMEDSHVSLVRRLS